jgi:hypothetical protein
MKEFTRGDTIWFTATFRDENNALTDPSSTWGAVYDSSSTVVSSIESLTKIGVGEYMYSWQSSRDSAVGMGAFEACGVLNSKIYVNRDKLFRLV